MPSNARAEAAHLIETFDHRYDDPLEVVDNIAELFCEPTPAMVRAGVLRLLKYSPEGDLEDEAVTEIFRAMMAASQGPRSLMPPES
jgi:hypothetical protein